MKVAIHLPRSFSQFFKELMCLSFHCNARWMGDFCGVHPILPLGRKRNWDRHLVEECARKCSFAASRRVDWVYEVLFSSQMEIERWTIGDIPETVWFDISSKDWRHPILSDLAGLDSTRTASLVSYQTWSNDANDLPFHQSGNDGCQKCHTRSYHIAIIPLRVIRVFSSCQVLILHGVAGQSTAQ